MGCDCHSEYVDIARRIEDVQGQIEFSVAKDGSIDETLYGLKLKGSEVSEAANGAGHVYLPMPLLARRAAAILEAGEELVENALRALMLEDALIAEPVGDETAVYLPRFHRAECETARLLLRLRDGVRPAKLSEREALSRIDEYERDAGVQLCAEQRQAALAALQEQLVRSAGRRGGSGGARGRRRPIEGHPRRPRRTQLGPNADGRGGSTDAGAESCPARPHPGAAPGSACRPAHTDSEDEFLCVGVSLLR